jgi:hypothetical protein
VQFGRRLINFVLFSNVYLAVIIALACYATSCTFDISVSNWFYLFIVCSTCSSYCLHWALPQPINNANIREQWSQRNICLLVSFAVFTFALGLVCLKYLPANAFWYILPLVFFTFLYTAPKINRWPFTQLRKVVVAKTFYLSSVLTYATVFLPLLVYHTALNIEVFAYALIRFCSIFIICLLFDYRDRNTDATYGINTFLTNRNPNQFLYCIRILNIIAMLVSLLCLFAMPMHVCFGLVMQCTIPIIILIALSKKAVGSNNVHLYYGVLDGLLAIHVLGCWFT